MPYWACGHDDHTVYPLHPLFKTGVSTVACERRPPGAALCSRSGPQGGRSLPMDEPRRILFSAFRNRKVFPGGLPGLFHEQKGVGFGAIHQRPAAPHIGRRHVHGAYLSAAGPWNSGDYRRLGVGTTVCGGREDSATLFPLPPRGAAFHMAGLECRIQGQKVAGLYEPLGRSTGNRFSNHTLFPGLWFGGYFRRGLGQQQTKIILFTGTPY